jgi:hypothetical protein
LNQIQSLLVQERDRSVRDSGKVDPKSSESIPQSPVRSREKERAEKKGEGSTKESRDQKKRRDDRHEKSRREGGRARRR